MNLTKQQQRWINQLGELWKFFDKRLRCCRLETDDKRLQLLLSLTIATHRLTRGFLEQLKGGSNDNLQSKLRTLTEAYINAKYILSGDNDFRARAFILDSKIVRVKRLNDIIRLMEQDKAPSMEGVSKLESYRQLRDSLKQENSKEQNSLGEQNAKWPSVYEIAKKVGLEEYYHTAFYLFSQDNHMSADGMFRFLNTVNGVTTFTTALDLSNLDEEIQTAYFYYLQFINLCAVLPNFPTQEELTEFNSSEMLSAIPSSMQ